MKREISAARIREIAQGAGALFAGWVSDENARSILAVATPALARWQSQGFAGEMRYMQRESHLYSSFDAILSGATGVLSFLFPYASDPVTPLTDGHGKVARYAWGKDYHTVLRLRLEQIMATISAEISTPVRWRAFTDAVPILERAIGARAGAGFIGKSSLLIRHGIGTYGFLAEVVSDLHVDAETPVPGRLSILRENPPGTGCGSCERCIRECPTEAIVGPGEIDARRCIAYLTIEKRGAFTEDEQRNIGEWLFGCDVCQEVCPFNTAAAPRELPEFRPEAGAGRTLEIAQLLQLRSTAEFRRMFADTPILRAGYPGLVRNACAVAGNTRLRSVAPLLEARLNDELVEIRTAASIALQHM